MDQNWPLFLPNDFPWNFPQNWILLAEDEFGIFPDQAVNVFKSGQVPRYLVMGKLYRYQNRKNSDLFLWAYCRPDEEAFFLIKWGIGSEYQFKEFGAALNEPNGSWRIKQLDEVIVWHFPSAPSIFPYFPFFEKKNYNQEHSSCPINLN